MGRPFRACLVLPGLTALLLMTGCDSGGSIPKATQPNGPPKAPAPAPEKPDGATFRKAAIEKAIPFAQAKYKDRLDYTKPDATYCDPKLYDRPGIAGMKALSPPGSWEVALRTHRSRTGPPTPMANPDVTDPSLPEAGIAARVFVVLPDGSIKEGEPRRSPF